MEYLIRFAKPTYFALFDQYTWSWVGNSFPGARFTKDNVKSLGVTFDRTLSFDAHVQLTVRACNFHLAALRHIRPVMSDDVANTVGCSIVGSKQARLLQCTALWHVSKNIAKLQRTQNNLARVVCNNKDSSTHSETLLHQLH